MKKNKLFIIAMMAFAVQSCDIDTDLDVVDVESPNSVQIGNEATANKIFQNWYVSGNSYAGPGMAMATMADQMTCSWGNAGMRDLSSEPRIEFNNASTYGSSFITEDFFNSLNSVLADSNGITAGVLSGAPFSDVDKVESLARFGQAASIGYLSLVFDKVFISDESGTLNEGEAVSYNVAMNLALEKLDLAIAAADRGSFTLDAQINGVTYSNTEWSQFLNSFGARLLVNNARNNAERQAVDWSRVLDYANNGLSNNLEVLADGYNSWYSEWPIYMIYPGWARVDLRVVNLMDPNYPSYWPEGAVSLDPATSADARLESDFQYKSSQDFPANRGTYHYSSYRYKRYDEYTNSGWEAFHPEFLAAENDLYKAEALLMMGDVEGAAAVINASTRVTRGNLDPVSANATDVKDAIFYERMIELAQTGLGLSFFEMRGQDLLQKGTFLHFPVPGAALDAAGLAAYTFGGSTGTPGQDYSNGGWR